MRTFFDSSALAKRYVAESGTPRVLQLCSQAQEIMVAVIAVPELVSAFNRLRREGRLLDTDYLFLKSELAADVAAATVIELTSNVVAQALDCLERFPLRAMDALHLGAALTSGAQRFVSGDQRQCQAARNLALLVEQV